MAVKPGLNLYILVGITTENTYLTLIFKPTDTAELPYFALVILFKASLIPNVSVHSAHAFFVLNQEWYVFASQTFETPALGAETTR